MGIHGLTETRGPAFVSWETNILNPQIVENRTPVFIDQITTALKHHFRVNRQLRLGEAAIKGFSPRKTPRHAPTKESTTKETTPCAKVPPPYYGQESNASEGV